jgi:hypothetical protein
MTFTAQHMSSITSARWLLKAISRGPNPVSTYNYYGGNIGGPIIHNKIFIFGDFLHVSDHQGQFNILTVPTAAFRAGDLSAGGNNIYDPSTGNADGTKRSQFVYMGTANVIDPARISPIARNILALCAPSQWIRQMILPMEIVIRLHATSHIWRGRRSGSRRQ